MSNVAEIRRAMCALIVFFVMAHGWSLLSHSVAWDGFAYYELLKAGDFHTVVVNHINDAFPPGAVTYGIVRLFPDPILAGKVLAFLCELTAALAFLFFLRRTSGFGPTLCWFAASLFCLHNNVLVYIGFGMFNYEFTLALFAVAAVLHIRAGDAPQRALRLLLHGASAALFFVSFYNASLLVFYAAVVLGFYRMRFGSLSLERQRVLTFLREQWLFLLLPFAAFLLRPAAQGNYVAENHITISRYWVIGYFEAAVLNVLPTLAAPFRALAAEPPLLFVLAGFWAASRWLLRRVWSDETLGSFRDAFWLAAFTFVLAVFPFAAVGKIPSYKDWGSRYAELIPVSQGLIIAAILWFGTRRISLRARQALVALVLALFALSAFENWRRWDADWMKQAAAIDQLKALPEAREAHTIWFLDETPQLNNMERYYRFYEYNAWMLEAYADGQHRLGVAAHNVPAKVTDPLMRKTFLVSDYFPPETPRAVVTIARGTMDPLRLGDYLRLKWRELFSGDPHWADPVVTLRAQRLPDTAPAPSQAP